MEQDIMQLIRARHSVRQYRQRPVAPEAKQAILDYLQDLRAESGLDIRFAENADQVFGGVLLRFVGWKKPPAAYVSFLGEKNPETEEKMRLLWGKAGAFYPVAGAEHLLGRAV